MMRTLFVAGAAIAVLTTSGVEAQQVIAHGPPPAAYPAPGASYGHPPVSHAGRWGSKVDGHWWGGVNAPGGWRAYRRPSRGWTLPGYWVSPRFAIQDWGSYGLPQPPAGYGWSRYYDDAVLIDDRGSIYDTVDGIDWDGGYDAGYAAGDYAGGDAVYASPSDRGYAYPPGSADRWASRGRNRRVPVAPDYPPPPPPPPQDYARPAPPPPPPPVGPGWSSADGSVTVVTTGGFYGGSTTVVTVQSPPVITRTTTDIYEDRVTYHRPVYRPVRKVVRRHVWRPRCGCR